MSSLDDEYQRINEEQARRAKETRDKPLQQQQEARAKALDKGAPITKDEALAFIKEELSKFNIAGDGVSECGEHGYAINYSTQSDLDTLEAKLTDIINALVVLPAPPDDDLEYVVTVKSKVFTYALVDDCQTP